ncbi:hypothetical protein BZA77DRAFT_352620 [Pyronema omphalodes]|nr:hypothetical protein BZA77DRAFT_352620 [Pyronema omphalodes]
MKLTTALFAISSLSALPLNSAAPIDASSASSSSVSTDLAAISLCNPPPDHFPSPFDSAAGPLTFTIVGGLLIAGQWILNSLTGCCHWSPCSISPPPLDPAPELDFLPNNNPNPANNPVVKISDFSLGLGDFNTGYIPLLFGEHGSIADYDDHLTEEPESILPNMAEMPGSMPVVPGPPVLPGPAVPAMPQIPGSWPVTPANSISSVSSIETDSTIPDMPGGYPSPQGSMDSFVSEDDWFDAQEYQH